ncbi:MAG: hypothetical protein HC924_11790 [Synechococcaceae cyanobacterium SM2_3_2]|nr:hypothetical protein [Synechococcaceae cyanobacterium SM2_3_2]
MKPAQPPYSLSRDAQQVYLVYQNGILMLMGWVWLLIGIPSLWALRQDVVRLIQHFTWTGLRFSLLYKPGLPSFGLLFCLVLTLYVLLSQSRYELVGLIESERHLLELTAQRLRKLPSHHFLHRFFLAQLPPVPEAPPLLPANPESTQAQDDS